MNCPVFSQKCLVDRTLSSLQSCVVLLEYYFLFKSYLFFSGKGKLLQICKFVNFTYAYIVLSILVLKRQSENFVTNFLPLSLAFYRRSLETGKCNRLPIIKIIFVFQRLFTSLALEE